MKTLTDEQIDQCIDASITNYSTTAISLTDCMRAVALRVLALAAEPEQPDPTCERCVFGDGRPATASPCCDCPNTRVSQFRPKPETLDRRGQYLRSKDDPQLWFGPVTSSDRVGHHGTISVNNVPWCISERWITNGDRLRIPPPPLGVDLEGWDCREPVKGEQWYTLTRGVSTLVLSDDTPTDHPIYHMNRWIEPPAAKRPWPVGPFNVCKADKLYYVCDGKGDICVPQCFKAEADAIALALDWTERAAARFRQMLALYPTPVHPTTIKALVAELAGWDFSLCLAGRNQEAEEGGHT